MKKVFFIVMVCLMTVTAFGQQEKTCPKHKGEHGMQAGPRSKQGAKEWMDQKKEQRRAFIIKAMDLTEAEEAAFVAIYDDYNKKTRASKHIMNKAMRALNDTLTDEEFTKNLDIVNAQTLEQAKITDEFYQAMKKVLPIKKVYLYYKADKEFNKLMMRDMKRGPKHEPKKVEK